MSLLTRSQAEGKRILVKRLDSPGLDGVRDPIVMTGAL